MGSLARITSTFFVDLINRLGVRPPFAEGFELSSTVIPVSLVDTNVTLPANVSTQLLQAPLTNGNVAAPVAATVLADSGAFTAGGNYSFTFTISSLLEGNGTTVEIARRNAANAADIWFCSLAAGIQGCPPFPFTMQIKLDAGERVVVRQGAQNGAGASVYRACIWF